MPPGLPTGLALVLVLWLCRERTPAAGALPQSGTEAGGRLLPVISEIDSNLFVRSDTCKVYVLRDGDAALLIDLGDGSVLDHLSEIGVGRVEWVLFTDHHREHCQGGTRLPDFGAKVAAPEAERALFERPADFRKMDVNLGDPFTIHGASYVRPLVQAIPLDCAFGNHEDLHLA